MLRTTANLWSNDLCRLIMACLLVLAISHGRLFAEPPAVTKADPIRELQRSAFEQGTAVWGYWGIRPERYSGWTDHSNRLVPIYTYGIGLGKFTGANSCYRNESALASIYTRTPQETLNDAADYMDQTDICRLQRLAVDKLHKKFVFLVIFDGMDWQTTQAASIYKLGRVAYTSGRGTGLLFQDYRGTSTDFGWMVTSAFNGGLKLDVDAQTVAEPRGKEFGGYCAQRGGSTPWSHPSNGRYLLCRDKNCKHTVTDSAASATSMTSGIKTYNGAVNVAPDGKQVTPIAAWLQSERGFAVGAISSVPLSHATPACAYANNVARGDYQDLSRDLLGLPSASHPNNPLSGLDVVMGGGWGETSQSDNAQGTNFVPGNTYLTAADLETVNRENGGKYVVAQRTPGRQGSLVLQHAVDTACRTRARLLGFFGTDGGHLPYRTADGAFNPLRERYTEADVAENPRLAEMTKAAIDVLHARADNFWLMVEAGDVDWANHANNIDDSIGAVFDGDDAFRVIVDWIDSQDAWEHSVVIVTADHGHYFVLDQPEALIPRREPATAVEAKTAAVSAPAAAVGNQAQ